MNSDSASYDTFAWMYNRYWGTRFTPSSVAVLEEVIFPSLPANAEILDLCCGTGQLAAILKERGYKVTGLDSSGSMLEHARENAPDVEFIHADVAEFDLPESFDLVTSFFDSLNHVLTVPELVAVFQNVYKCLKPGGRFLFDLNLEAGYHARWKGSNGITEDDHSGLFKLTWDPETRIASFDGTVYRLNNGWYRSEVHLKQRCYGIIEISALIEAVGFTLDDTFEYTVPDGKQPLQDDSDRGFFLATKKNSDLQEEPNHFLPLEKGDEEGFDITREINGLRTVARRFTSGE